MTNKFSLFIKKYFYVFLIVVFIVFIYFSLVSSLGPLSIESRNNNLDLGIYNNEREVYGFTFVEKDAAGSNFRWSARESELLVRVSGGIMIIPVFNSKPDISTNPVRISFFINGVQSYVLNQVKNESHNISINLGEKGIGKNGFVRLSFKSNTSWTPKQYGLSDDTREISFAVKEIYFID